ncbi:MAG TPA: phosphoribosylamine--glycine ligase [Candidatus Acidoferrales bacterium]|nr:phosphoribosylamine--glycine ligase [Candidatus Acidoferrales bacterium]
MKVMVIGGGAREHALVWKLRQSPRVEHIWCVPGNAGIAELAECIYANPGEVQNLAELAQRLKPDLTIVGPEQPLVLGIADEFEKRGLALLGPSRAASQLEGSKIFAKEFMTRHGIPTANAYGIFDNAVDAYTSLCEVDWPVVVKADGLCAGKGVLVTSSPDEATSFIERLMEKNEFGDAGRRVIIEEGLVGREISYIVLTDGENFAPFAPARDYKRAFDGDTGPNTGGMGAISSADLLSVNLERDIQDKIVRPTLAGISKDSNEYFGFLYFGLMLTADGPKVLEFNCRLGDPETEALVMRMDFDLAAAAEAALAGNLREFRMNWAPAASACVVLAAAGYPGKPQTGKEITGITSISTDSSVALFHGATRREDNKYYNSSGRTLVVSASAASMPEARARVYQAAQSISFEGMHYRKDIGGELGSAAAK